MANQVEIVITSSQRGRGFADADRAMDKLERKSGRLKSALGGVGRIAGGIMAANLAQGLGDKAVGFFQDSTEAASDLEEALSKSNTVFGEQAAAIEAFASSAAQNFGLSKGAALDAAGGFGNMFDQLGIGEEQASAMSQSMIGLAADFASFNNLETADVLDAQSAAMRGEFDSLQRVLPLINAATVQQKALAQTGKASAKELTQQEKAMATYALMVEGAGEAQGDFAKTSDGLANSQRIAEAEMANMRAEIGTKLMPVAKKITELKLKLAKVLADKLLPAFEKITKALKPFVKAGLERIQKILPSLSKWFDETRGKIMVFVDGIKGIEHALNPDSTIGKFNRLGLKVKAFRDIIIRDVVPKVRAGAKKMAEIWERIRPTIGKALTKIGQIIEGVADLIITVIRRVIDVTSFIWDRWGDEISRVAESSFRTAAAVIQAVSDIILGIVRVFTSILKGDWSGAWEGLKQVSEGAMNAVHASVQGIIDLIKIAFDLLIGYLRGLGGRVASAVSGMWDGLWSGFRGVINNIIKAWNGLEFKIPSVSLFGKTIGGQTIGTPNLPLVGTGGGGPRGSGNVRRFAHGGLGSGLRLVGEHGAELVNLGAGGSVLSNPDTERVMSGAGFAGAGGGAGVNVTVNVTGSVISERELVGVVRDELVRGGLLDAFTSGAVAAL